MLILNKPMSSDERFMREVYLVSNSQSRDPRTKIGSVIVKNEDIISTGFNNFPRKVADLESRYLDRPLKLRMVVHAEANSIYNCARKGISCLGGKLYTQGIPCSNCAKSIIQGGIAEVIIHKQWPNLTHSQDWLDAVELTKLMFEEAGVTISIFDKELKITGFLDGKEINV